MKSNRCRWINKTLKAVRAPISVRRLIRKLVRTDIEIATINGPKTISVDLKRGVFQGDSLSPLLFCLCIAPLSRVLSRRPGFSSRYQEEPVCHQFFMDDLKVYEEDKERLDETAGIVEEAMGMTLGLRKCATAHAIRGRVVEQGDTVLPTGGTMEEVQYGQSYKYLGVKQLMGAELGKVRETEYLRRVRKTWKSRLSAKNKAKVHNTWCTAVLR